MTPALPMTAAELTPAWFGTALGFRHPGVAVRDVAVLDVKQSTSTKVFVRLAYDVAADAPERLVVKGCFDEPSRPVCGPANVNEAVFYASVAPELAIEVPRCFYAASDASALQGVMLLEDLTLRGCRFGRGGDPVAVETMRALLDMQAELHARWWDRALPPGVVDRGGAVRAGAEFLLGADNWEDCLASEPRRAIQAELPPPLRERAVVASAVGAMLDGWRRRPPCALHGDLHPGNLYYVPDGRPGLVDWQLWIGPWAHDVAHSIAGMLETGLRRRHERELLAFYLERLAARGIAAPSFEEAWLDYRRHVIWGFLWIVCPASMQPEDVIVTQAARYARAALDLETFAALAAA